MITQGEDSTTQLKNFFIGDPAPPSTNKTKNKSRQNSVDEILQRVRRISIVDDVEQNRSHYSTATKPAAVVRKNQTVFVKKT